MCAIECNANVKMQFNSNYNAQPFKMCSLYWMVLGVLEVGGGAAALPPPPPLAPSPPRDLLDGVLWPSSPSAPPTGGGLALGHSSMTTPGPLLPGRLSPSLQIWTDTKASL